MGVKLNLVLALMLLLPNFHCLNWQGTGTMTFDMMSVIWNFINTNFDPTIPTASVSDSTNMIIPDFAAALSKELNDRWDKAWNVVINYLYGGDNMDTVLYGYAFNGHWFWYNGYVMNDGYFVTFLIWKDYNCVGYLTYNTNIDSGASYTDTTALDAFTDTQLPNWRWDNVWEAAHSYVENLQKEAEFKESAFAIVVSQSSFSSYFANVCAQAYYVRYNPATNGDTTGGTIGTWGDFLLFQMR
jgi:hypothetical protein